MATLRQTIDINANNLTTQQSLSTQVINNFTATQGGILRETITEVVGAPKALLAHGSYVEGTKVYMKNAGTTHDIYVDQDQASVGAGEDAYTRLRPGDWCLFSWSAATTIAVYCTNAAGSSLEYGVFEA